MRLLSKTIFLFLSVGMLITACNKDDQINEIVPENPNYTPDTTIVNNLMSELVANPSGGLDLGCMSIDFPIGLELQSGATLTVQDQASLDVAMNGQGDDRVVSFVYPMAVQQADGSFVQMQSNYELSASYASCIPDQGWDRAAASGDLIPAYLLGSICLEIVYPVNLIDGDDQPYVANNEAELIDLIVSIHELYFDLPFTVITESGDQVAIIDVDTFFDTVFDCDDITPACCRRWA
jgi:hypothetical protein